ncbi:hypothetical protein K469DRAFT_691672 [Zopfia rhizophila CBS 207.26]|uniref:Uncharacterized protein n=1 Tax=Zopfia rhizophila CBS 207.26 TaxID=1314779 RepID=A0A6A6DWK7_9PEZI|nr:hypothetical protein K469DRAFT_691672 [Zopfia rhizophila CBS 207.26]
MPINWGGLMYLWASVQALLLLLGVAAFACFVCHPPRNAHRRIRGSRRRHSYLAAWMLPVEYIGTAKWIGLNILPGLGIGLPFPGMDLDKCLKYATQTAADQKDVAHAASMHNFIRAFGQAIGVAVGGPIFQDKFKCQLLLYPELKGQAVQYAKDTAALVELLKAIGVEGEEGLAKEAIVAAYAHSLKVLWIVMAGLAALALVASGLIKELSLDEKLESQQGIRQEGDVESSSSR